MKANELLRAAQNAAAELNMARPTAHTPPIDVESMLLALSATSGNLDTAKTLVAKAAEMSQALNATTTEPHREKLTTRHALLAIRATVLAEGKGDETAKGSAKGSGAKG